jgi:hypothetical protein
VGPVACTNFFALVSAMISLGDMLFGVTTARARVHSRRLGISVNILTVASCALVFLSMPGHWGDPPVQVVGDDESLWRDRLPGGPGLVWYRALSER